ncbi:MAG: hypothetical protein GF317_03395 [Candidatus Lokiarchaeota archaeon]|nr:hypothetical protein [Candidatus Lokiarchaeota archaeon]MBD3350050.1 hypothetical protein [Candidatus Lokiarchaeota archaeon]
MNEIVKEARKIAKIINKIIRINMNILSWVENDIVRDKLKEQIKEEQIIGHRLRDEVPKAYSDPKERDLWWKTFYEELRFLDEKDSL